MRSPRCRPQLLLALSLLPLLSTGCATRSTQGPSARIERPRMPRLDAELTATEQLQPLTAKPRGQLITIDAGILEEVYQRLAEAIAAVTRGNIRAGAVRLERACTTAIVETGSPAAGCPD